MPFCFKGIDAQVPQDKDNKDPKMSTFNFDYEKEKNNYKTKDNTSDKDIENIPGPESQVFSVNRDSMHAKIQNTRPEQRTTQENILLYQKSRGIDNTNEEEDKQFDAVSNTNQLQIDNVTNNPHFNRTQMNDNTMNTGNHMPELPNNVITQSEAERLMNIQQNYQMSIYLTNQFHAMPLDQLNNPNANNNNYHNQNQPTNYAPHINSNTNVNATNQNNNDTNQPRRNTRLHEEELLHCHRISRETKKEDNNMEESDHDDDKRQ